MKDQICTRDCTKYTSKLPQSRNRFKFTYNYFPFTDWTELYFVHQKSMEVGNTFYKIIDFF